MLAVQAVLLTLFRYTQNGLHHTGASVLALWRADVSLKSALSASLHQHTSLQSEGKALDVQRLFWGTCCSSPSKQEAQKKNSQRDTSFVSGCCKFWIRSITSSARLTF